MYFFIVISFFDETRVSKQNSPRSDAAFCGVTSGAILFAYVPGIKRLTGLYGLTIILLASDEGKKLCAMLSLQRDRT